METPRYRLTEKFYWLDRMYDPENNPDDVEIDFPDVPGPFMEPLNAAAEAQIEKYHAQARPDFHNTVNSLPMTIGGPALPDAASYSNETTQNRPPEAAPLYSKETMKNVDTKNAPRLPRLGR